MEEKQQAHRAPWKEVAIATLIVVGGWAAMSGVLQASLPDKAETPVQAQAPLTPDANHYVADRHGPTVDYMGRTYAVVGRPVVVADKDVSAAGDTAEDVRIWFLTSEATERTGGGGGGRASGSLADYPTDKGPLMVKIGPTQYRLLQPVAKQ